MLELNLIGNVGQNAKIVEANGAKFISFSVGTNEKFKNAEGESVEKTTWVSCILSKDSKILDYLVKGTKVYVSGDLSVKVYKDSEGVNKAAVNCRVRRVELLSSKPIEQGSEARPEPAIDNQEPSDDLPF